MHPNNALGAAMNLLSFGHFQFERITFIQEISTIKKLSEDFSPSLPPNHDMIAKFAFEQLINSIRLTICFENLMKSILLCKGYLIHRLSKSDFPVLYKEQSKRPILIDELLKVSSWTINPDLKLVPQELNSQIKGITRLTIGMKELLSEKYVNVYKIDDEILTICRPYFKYRNNLHLYMSEEFAFNGNLHSELIKLIDFVNNHIVRINNVIVDKLKKGDSYKLDKIIY
jgi:hypothetical protein